MPQIPLRLKILLAAGVLGGGYLWLGSGGAPTPKRAAAATAAAAQGIPLPRWEPLDATAGQRAESDYHPLVAPAKRDLFMPDDELCTLLAAPVTPGIGDDGNGPATPTVEDAADFSTLHMLSGVMLGRYPQAVIDGVPRAIGDTVDGWHLTAITETAATLRNPTTGAVTTLPLKH